MKSIEVNLKITRELIDWVESILKNRISSNISLDFKINPISYDLRITNNKNYFKFPLFKAFYEFGPQKDMPCGRWIPSSENINFFNYEVATPGIKTIDRLISVEENIIFINYDIIGLIYWNFSRCEEILTDKNFLDQHKRFQSKSSHAFQNKYLLSPIVDEWIFILKEIIKKYTSQIQFEKKKFKFNLTHDVDLPSLSYSQPQNIIKLFAQKNYLKKRSINKISEYIKLSIKGNTESISPIDPYNSFEWIMDQSESIGTKSSFYFIPDRLNKRYDGLYSIDDKPIENLIELIHNRGHFIGIHPGFDSYNSKINFSNAVNKFQTFIRKKNINQNEWGGRMHYLRWIWPETSYFWSDSFMTYDSSLGYFDSPGFRCGTCHEFEMFDPIAQKRLNIIQRPLIVMDVSIMHYLGLDLSKEGLELISDLVQKCKNVNGIFTLLWHNNYLYTTEQRNYYRIILNQ